MSALSTAPSNPASNAASVGQARPRSATKKTLRVRLQIALRSFHVYSSMATLLLVLFFSVSGLLLNHPEWVPQGVEKTYQYSGRVNKAWLKPTSAGASAEGNTGGTQNTQPTDTTSTETTNWLQIVETLRERHDLRGRASEFQNDGSEATLSFLSAGREASVVINAKTGKYEIEETSHGLLAMLGDLHRGHQTGAGWNWVIDLTAAFLIFISLTGFGILLYLKKVRQKAMLTLLGGSVLSVLAIVLLA